jgi:hypothetical protein
MFIDYKRHHRKGVEIYDTTKSIYSKNLGFVEQKCLFEPYREVQNKKKYIGMILS